MCGRYSLFAPPRVVEQRFDATFAFDVQPRYNVAPGQSVPVITGDEPETIRQLEWGLVPQWADDPDDAPTPINARAETIEEKPTFRDAVANRRCLVLADGFYEWAEADDGKRPYRIAYQDDRPFALAGIWERWEGTVQQVGLDAFADGTDADTSATEADPKTRRLETISIVTTEPSDLVADVHDRMPVILTRGCDDEWLEAETPAERERLLGPLEDEELRSYPVSTAVNDPTNDSPSVVEPVADG